MTRHDVGTIDTKVGKTFKVEGRAPPVHMDLKIKFPAHAFKLVNEKEGGLIKNLIGAGQSKTYTLEALAEGEYKIECQHVSWVNTVPNYAEVYTVRVKR